MYAYNSGLSWNPIKLTGVSGSCRDPIFSLLRIVSRANKRYVISRKFSSAPSNQPSMKSSRKKHRPGLARAYRLSLPPFWNCPCLSVSVSNEDAPFQWVETNRSTLTLASYRIFQSYVTEKTTFHPVCKFPSSLREITVSTLALLRRN